MNNLDIFICDTGGNFYLGIRLEVVEQITRQERLRRNSRIWRINHPNRYKKHLEYVRDWKRRNKDRIRVKNVLRKEHMLIINSNKKWKNEVEELEQEVDMQVSENDIC